jgi:oligopeptide transport system substrate-binding protein
MPKVLSALLILQAGLWMTSCRKEGTGGSDRPLVVANSAEPSSLDLHAVTGQPELRVLGALYEGLVIRGLKEEGVRPGVAHAWEMSGDGKTYTFHLRPARWSDGTPLTARDFLRSWRRFIDPKTASEYSSLLDPLRNGPAIRAGKLPPDSLGVSAPDDTTLVAALTHPVGYFLDLCAFEPFSPVPVDTIAKYGNDWTAPGRLVGNGPYRMLSWKRNVEIVAERNPHYWDSATVKQARIVFKPVEDQQTAFNMYMGREVDWIFNVPPGKLEMARKRPDFFTRPTFGTYYYIVNCRKPGYSNRDLRLALSYAIDRAKIVERVMKKIPVPATGLVPPTPAYAGPGLDLFDPAKAKEHLAKSGFGPGNPPKDLQILYNTAEVHKDIAEVIRQMWKETLGIEAQLVNYEWKVYLDNTKNLNYPALARASWIGDFPDPVTFLQLHATTDGNNRTGYSNPAYDAALRESDAIADPAKRLEKLLEAEKILMADMPIIPIYYYALTEMRHEKLRNAFPNPIGMYSWKDIHLDP